MDISNIVDATPEESLKEILKYLLESYTTPAFGALPKNEIELIFLNALEKLGAISTEPPKFMSLYLNLELLDQSRET